MPATITSRSSPEASPRTVSPGRLTLRAPSSGAVDMVLLTLPAPLQPGHRDGLGRLVDRQRPEARHDAEQRGPELDGDAHLHAVELPRRHLAGLDEVPAGDPVPLQVRRGR